MHNNKCEQIIKYWKWILFSEPLTSIDMGCYEINDKNDNFKIINNIAPDNIAECITQCNTLSYLYAAMSVSFIQYQL